MKLVQHLVGYAPVKLAGFLVGFGGVYAFTRLLGGEDYGRYALMISVQALVHTLTLTWAEAAAFRFAAEADASGSRAAHMRTLLGLTAKSLAVTAVVLAIVALIFHGHPEYLAILPWIAVLIPLNTVVQTALETHRAHHSVGRYALVATSIPIIGFILGILIAWKTDAGAAAPFMGLVAITLFAALREGRWLLTEARGAKSDPVRAKQALAFGLPIAFALVLDMLLSVGDRFLLAYFLDEYAVGAYAAGYGVADKTVLILCSWAAMAGSPLVLSAWEREGPNGAQREARGLISFILLAGLPAATGLALVAQPLAEVMIAEDLREQAAHIIPWIAFAGLFNGLLIHYWTEAFQLVRKTGERAVLMAIPALANLGANAVLIPWLGLMGAVYATLGSYILGNLVLALAGRRHFALPLPLLDLARLALSSGAMAGVVLMLPSPGGMVELILKASVGGLVYVCAAVALNAGGSRDLLATRINAWSNSRKSA